MLQLIRDGNCEDIGHTDMTRHGTRAQPQQWDINSASLGSLDPYTQVLLRPILVFQRDPGAFPEWLRHWIQDPFQPLMPKIPFWHWLTE